MLTKKFVSKYEKDCFVIKCKTCGAAQLSQSEEIVVKYKPKVVYYYVIPCKYCGLDIEIKAKKLSLEFREKLIRAAIKERFGL